MTNNSRNSLIILTFSPRAIHCAGGRKRCANPKGSKIDAIWFRRKSLTIVGKNRTVSH
jgi:hypothetical protein